MISAVISFSEKLHDNQLYNESDYIGVKSFCEKGNYSRNLLKLIIQELVNCKINDIIVVNYANQINPKIRLDNAKVINVNDKNGFSEWNAKFIGIKSACNDYIITVNADVLVPKKLVEWFSKVIYDQKYALYQGTKLWLNSWQTNKYITSNKLLYCTHEVLIENVESTELPICGIEPVTWQQRRKDSFRYTKELGLDCWKNSGDFQAFHRDLLKVINYPLDLYGWGWGDNEIRLRVKEAGLKEIWNRNYPVFHLHHPVLRWEKRKNACLININKCNRNIDFEKKEWVKPPVDYADIVKDHIKNSISF